MSLITITARFQCDLCGKQFEVDVPTDWDLKHYAEVSTYDLAVDAIRGTGNASVAHPQPDLEQHCCPDCTEKLDWTCDNCDKVLINGLDEFGKTGKWLCPSCLRDAVLQASMDACTIQRAPAPDGIARPGTGGGAS